MFLLHQALAQLLLSPRCLCLPAELQLLWAMADASEEGESCTAFSARVATSRPASAAGRGWEIQVAWLAAHSGPCIHGPLQF